MKRYTRWTTTLFFTIFLFGCKTAQETSGSSAANKTTRNPHFINGMAMGGNQNNISTPVVDGNNKYIYQDNRKATDRTDEKKIHAIDTAATVVTSANPVIEGKYRKKNRKKHLDNDTAIAINTLPDKAPDKVTIVPQKTILTKLERRSLTEKYAGMMGVDKGDISDYALYEFIDEWYGVDYRLGGNDMDGIDCSAFVQRLYTDVFGVCLLRTAIDQFNNSSWVKKTKKLQEGDLVFFHTHGRHVTHVGVYLMNNYFVHASTSQGVVISNLNDDYWKKHYAGGGKIPHGYDVSVK